VAAHERFSGERMVLDYEELIARIV
jgi:hypothetical protein